MGTRHTTPAAGGLLLCALWAGTAPAQPPLGSRLGGLAAILRNGDPAQRAWAAWIAGEQGRADTAPGLRAALRDLRPEDRVHRLAARVVLDALIRLEAAVADPVLLPWATSLPDPVIVLAARDPARHEPTFQALWSRRRQADAQWVASGNVLVARRAPGIARSLLEGLEVDVTITVVEDLEIGLGSGTVRMGFGSGRLEVPEGFPPVPIWTLSTTRTDREVVGGRRPVYAARRVGRGRTIGVGSRRSLDRDPVRIGYLADLLETGVSGLGLADRYRHTLLWKDPRKLQAEARLRRERIEEAFFAVGRRLAGRGLLSPGELSAIAPNLRVTVDDRRRDTTVPLPDLRL